MALGVLLGSTRLPGRSDHGRNLPVLLLGRPGAVQDFLRGCGGLGPVGGYRGGPPEAVDHKRSAGTIPSTSARTRTAPTTMRGSPRYRECRRCGRPDRNANASQHGGRRDARLWQRPAVCPREVTEIWVPADRRHQRVLRRNVNLHVRPDPRLPPGVVRRSWQGLRFEAHGVNVLAP